jgi:hypothetical protein
MHAATNGEWNGGYNGQDIDGVDMWNSITTGAPSPRKEIVHVIGDDTDAFAAIVIGDMKYFKGANDPNATLPQYYFKEDLDSDGTVTECYNPTPFLEEGIGAGAVLPAEGPDNGPWSRPAAPAPRTAITSEQFTSSELNSSGNLFGFGSFMFFGLFVFFAALTIYSRSPKATELNEDIEFQGDFTQKFENIE